MRRARIVATIGPASRSPRVLRELIEAGMNICRLNFSHGSHDDHRRMVEEIRRQARLSGSTVGILQDLQGPRIRTGPIAGGILQLEEGRKITLTTRRVPGSAALISTTFSNLPREVEKGDSILLNDGLIQLDVQSVRGPDVHCQVVHGGPISSHKGMNIPGRKLSISAMTAKDRADLKLGVEVGVDWVALSFVRGADDIRLLKRALQRHGANIPVVAKLEKPQAISNLFEILAVTDAVMVARGDLAVETSPEEVPVIQKRVIREARRRGVPVITATQMLESMVENSRPTRAEASDVANAIYDGTDAVMLSAETATGRYPVETVRLMGRIVESAEVELAASLRDSGDVTSWWRKSVSDSICEAAATVAQGLNAAVVAVFTETGGTARRMAQQRPHARIIAFSPNVEVLRRSTLFWGMEPRLTPHMTTSDQMVDYVARALRREKIVKPGDRIVVTAGTPIGQPGTTNFLKVHEVT